MLQNLQAWFYRIEQWSKNYEYEVEGFVDQNISTSLKYKSLSYFWPMVIFSLIIFSDFFLPDNIYSIILHIAAPGLLFADSLNEFFVFLSIPLALFFYLTLINWAMNKFDILYLKNIGWKSSLISVLYFSIFAGFGLLGAFYLSEYKIFNIDLFYIVFAIFLIIYFFLTILLQPTFHVIWLELERQKIYKLISEEKYNLIKEKMIKQIDDSDLDAEGKKIIKDMMTSVH